MIGTLDRPTAGTVRLAGEEAATLSDRRLSALRARTIGFVFQQFHLLDGLNAVGNVEAALLYRGGRLARAPPAGRDGARPRRARAPAPAPAGRAVRRRAPARGAGPRDRRRAGVRARRRADRQPRLRLGRRRSSTCSAICTRSGSTVLVITHDREIADSLPRRIELRDGAIVADTTEAGMRARDTARHGAARAAHAPAARRRSRRSASRSASPRWSPSSASRPPAAPTCWRASTSSARTCSRSRPARRFLGDAGDAARGGGADDRADRAGRGVGRRPLDRGQRAAQLAHLRARRPAASACPAPTPTCWPSWRDAAAGPVPRRGDIDVPAVVLGADAASRLGIDRIGTLVYLGDRSFTVVGILDPVRARARARLVGADRPAGRRATCSTPTTPRRRSTCGRIPTASRRPRRARPHRQPARPGAGRGEPPVRRAGREVGGRLGVHLAAARARRGGAGGRRDRDRERDGRRRAGAPQRDRPAARARRHASARSARSSCASRS